VLPQDFEDTVHARQLKALCRRVGRRMSRHNVKVRDAHLQ